MKYFVFIFSIFLIAFACTKDRSAIVYGDYPDEVGRIIITKCATEGCHDDGSYQAAGGLNLSTWNKLFEGSPSGSPVIAGRADLSSLCYFINYQNGSTKLDPLLPSVKPFMPFNSTALSQQEYMTIKNWIADGALNKKGEKRFNNSIKEKYYVTNQGCDEVCVMDAKTGLPINYVHVGVSAGAELPHMVRVSPDGKYWYVCFIGDNMATTNSTANIFQKFDAETDQLIATCELKFNGLPISGSTSWNTFAIRPDGKEAIVTDLSNNGYVARVNLETMQNVSTESLGQKIHGNVYSTTGDTLYLLLQDAAQIRKVFLKQVNEFESIEIKNDPQTNPHDIIFTTDNKFYFVACQGIDEVRVFRASDDALVKIIPTGDFPQEFAVSKKRNLLFVTCMNDVTKAAPNTKGLVTVIDMNTFAVVHTITDVGYEPHGIAIDDNNNKIIVGNRNTGSLGPAPHHSTNCGGRNGFVSIFDLNTFQKLKRRIELLPDPYSVAFKPF
jgi:DNA-binding beta-propeller fold protein YncE